MPDDAMRRLILGPQAQELRGPGLETRPLLTRGLGDAETRILEHPALTITLRRGRDVIARHLVPAHIQLGQDVAIIGIAEIGRRVEEEGPARHPQPELALFVRMQRELIGLRRVALEPTGLRLAYVHDV